MDWQNVGVIIRHFIAQNKTLRAEMGMSEWQKMGLLYPDSKIVRPMLANLRGNDYLCTRKTLWSHSVRA